MRFVWGVLVLLASCSAGAGNEFKTTSYTSFEGRDGKPMAGDLLLSENRATFSELNGSMELQRVGAFKTGGDSETAGAAVFQIKNAEDFAEENPKGERFLQSGEVLRWLAVRHGRAGGEARGDWIRVCALSVGNWRDYTPDKLGLAWCVSFAEDEKAR